MSYQIIWTEKAENNLNQIFDYLSGKWSILTAIEFTYKVDYVIDLLKELPLIGIKSERDKQVRMILITTYNYLYYKIEGDKIYLLSIFETRQDPTKQRF
jgi:plasmid stabilization system protein ParE